MFNEADKRLMTFLSVHFVEKNSAAVQKRRSLSNQLSRSEGTAGNNQLMNSNIYLFCELMIVSTYPQA